MFVLLVELEAKAGKSAELGEVLGALVALAKNEAGIRHYAVQQPEGDTDKYILYESYDDKAAWEAHLRFAPAAEQLKKFDALLACPPKLTFCNLVAATSMA